MAVHVDGVFEVNAGELFGTDKPLIFHTTVTRNTKALTNLKPKNFALEVVDSPAAISPGKGTFSPPSDFTIEVTDPHKRARYVLTAKPVGGLSEGVVWIAGDYKFKVTAKVKVGFLTQKGSQLLAFSITAP